MGCRCWIVPALAASVVSTLSSQASATPRAPVRVVASESLPEECAGATALFERVRARTHRIQEVTGDDADARVHVRVQRDGERMVGELTIEDGAGRTDRVVSGPTCDDVVAAFAVMLVVALDPEAQPPPPSAEGPPEPGLAVEAEPEARRPAVGPRRRGAPRKLSKEPSVQLRGGVGVALPAYDGLVFEQHALLELRVEASLHPRARAAFARSAHHSVETASDRVDLVWTTGRGSFCGAPAWLHRHHLALCVGSAVGEVGASVVRPGGASRGLLWVTAGPSAVLDIELGWRLGVQLEAGVSFSLLRDRFYFEPRTLAYEAPRALPFLGATFVSHFFPFAK
ncbi:MAG: hypothetical protein KIS78_33585 [Labilithrix sp.]|nr:hypothetical protein [Labilithrix sp.]